MFNCVANCIMGHPFCFVKKKKEKEGKKNMGRKSTTFIPKLKKKKKKKKKIQNISVSLDLPFFIPFLILIPDQQILAKSQPIISKQSLNLWPGGGNKGFF